MKRFGALFLAAVLGSAGTIETYEWINPDEDRSVKMEYLSSDVPTSRVAYKVDEKGEVVPLDFTTAAEKVMPAVVHIRSTVDAKTGSQPQYFDPFRDFFGPRNQGPSQASGSGVIISNDGYSVTNNHVVKVAYVVEDNLYDKRNFKEEVICI